LLPGNRAADRRRRGRDDVDPRVLVARRVPVRVDPGPASLDGVGTGALQVDAVVERDDREAPDRAVRRRHVQPYPAADVDSRELDAGVSREGTTVVAPQADADVLRAAVDHRGPGESRKGAG